MFDDDFGGGCYARTDLYGSRSFAAQEGATSGRVAPAGGGATRPAQLDVTPLVATLHTNPIVDDELYVEHFSSRLSRTMNSTTRRSRRTRERGRLTLNIRSFVRLSLTRTRTREEHPALLRTSRTPNTNTNGATCGVVVARYAPPEDKRVLTLSKSIKSVLGAEQAAAPETLDLKVSKISHMRHRFESRATDAAS